ncbi:hypothetical protein Tco_0364911 [Tanacetum coccineum]
MEYAPTTYQHQQSEFSQPDSGLIVPVFQKGDDPIDAINHMVSVDNTSGPTPQRKEECTLQCALSSKEEKYSCFADSDVSKQLRGKSRCILIVSWPSFEVSFFCLLRLASFDFRGNNCDIRDLVVFGVTIYIIVILKREEMRHRELNCLSVVADIKFLKVMCSSDIGLYYIKTALMRFFKKVLILLKFNTTAGNLVKKILLKLNLSDHRLFKMWCSSMIQADDTRS